MFGENTYYNDNEDTYIYIEAFVRVKNIKHINYGIKVAPRRSSSLLVALFYFKGGYYDN